MLEVKKWNHWIAEAQKLHPILVFPLKGSFSNVLFSECGLYNPG